MRMTGFEVGLACLASVTMVAACGGGDDAATPDALEGAPDGAPGMDAPAVDAPLDGSTQPMTLADTGLCSDPGCLTINPGISTYTPHYALWSDGATKQRWMALPPGTQIDTSNMDLWKFPVGTKFWKAFTRDGIRVETRYMTKVLADDTAPGAWTYMTFAWNAAQDAATPVTMGVMNANGTQHDIPSRGNCRECHDSLAPSRILGFGAIQLDLQGAAGDLDLDDLIAQNLLTVPPSAAATPGAPHFPLPGNATDQATLGYFHANCGHCHNPTSGYFGHTPLDLRLRTTQLGTVAETSAYRTTVGVMGLSYTDNGTAYPTIIVPGMPDQSALIVRMNSLVPERRMPLRGSEVVDPAGQATIRAWIDQVTAP